MFLNKMNIIDAKIKISLVEQKLRRMQEICSFIDLKAFEEDERGHSFLESGEDMGTSYPDKHKEMQSCWSEIQKNVPPGFSIDGNLIRHLSFNEAHDWFDITEYDIPRELIKIDEYRKQLFLVEYLDGLHPDISRVSEIILNGDIDAALKAVYATLDSHIRSKIGIKPSEMTVPAIGKAFKDGTLRAVQVENNDAARNFLQGVIGYYRNLILHNPLPTARNRIDSSLSLFGLAYEAYKLFDSCVRSPDVSTR